MPDKIYFYLLILCGIWSQRITGTFADEETRESSDILVRQKRVINRIPGEDNTVLISWVPYIVRIRLNTRMNCVGSILSPYVVITSTLCVTYVELPAYSIVSGRAHLDKGNIHNVTDIRKHYGNYPERPRDGIALLTVYPFFEYGAYTNCIQLHSGPLLPGTLGIISGWGYNYRSADSGTSYPRSLRSIIVPIMAHRDCVYAYRPHFEISEKDVCTYHPQKHCGHNDGGAPLVVEGNLAGVHLWTGPGRGQNDPQYPDVFAVLQHSEYYHWIRTNIRDIEAQFQRYH